MADSSSTTWIRLALAAVVVICNKPKLRVGRQGGDSPRHDRAPERFGEQVGLEVGRTELYAEIFAPLGIERDRVGAPMRAHFVHDPLLANVQAVGDAQDPGEQRRPLALFRTEGRPFRVRELRERLAMIANDGREQLALAVAPAIQR